MKIQQHLEIMTVYYNDEKEMNNHCNEMLEMGYRVHLNREWRGKWKAYFTKDRVPAN